MVPATFREHALGRCQLAMRVALSGTGNVGWFLAADLARKPFVSELQVYARSPQAAAALVLDVASAAPSAAAKIVPGSPDCLGRADLVVLAAGAQPGRDLSARAHFDENRTAIDAIGDLAQVSRSATVVVVTSPVDWCTPYVQMASRLPWRQVIGFGGDLDTNRLRWLLRLPDFGSNEAVAVGEHGPRAIPVYQGPQPFDEISTRLRTYLRQVANLVGKPRNAATSTLVSALVDTIAGVTPRVHHVCGYHVKFQCHITWPFVVGNAGLEHAVDTPISGDAKRELEMLVASRRSDYELYGLLGASDATWTRTRS